MYDIYDPKTGTYLRTMRSGRNLLAPDGVTLDDASTRSDADLNVHGVYRVKGHDQRPSDKWQQVTASRAIVDGVSVWTWTTEPLPAGERASRLTALADQTMAAIDQAAEAARLAFVTAGSAQAMVYQEKREEAIQLQAMIKAGDTPDAADFPLLAAEVGVTAPNLADVAATVLVKAAAWRHVSAAIEGPRLSAKAAVAAAVQADDPDAVEAAAQISWPTPKTAENP